MSKLTDNALHDLVKSMHDSGGQANYLYAYNEDMAARFKELYPGIEVIIVEKGYMPTDTNLVLSKQRLHPGLTAEDSK